MTRFKNSSGFGVIGVVAALVIVGAIGFTGWYVWQTRLAADDKASSQISDSEKQPTVADPYAGWKTYVSDDQKLSFKYPGSWFIREDTASERVYVSTSSTMVTAEAIPAGFQQIWVSSDAQEASQVNENAIKAGDSKGRMVESVVTPGTITSGSLTIATYEYATVGGQTLEAFWTSSSGTRYYATNSTEVGKTNQQNMVDNLKKILATVQVQ